MKLKDLLIEQSNPKDLAEEFIREAQSGEWIISQKKGIDLWRGTNREVTVGVKEEYTENRNPMNTSADTQRMVDIVARRQMAEWPLRSFSRFASTRLSFVQSYGTPHYVFPHKDSKVVSFKKDAFITYFGRYNEEPGHFIEEFRKFFDKTEKDWNYIQEKLGEEIANFLSAYYVAVDGGDYNHLKKLASKHEISKHVDVFTEAHNLLAEGEVKMDVFGSSHLYGAIITGKKLVGNISTYFEEGERGIVKESEEVIIQGDLLHLKKSFADEYLKFENNSWQIDIF